MKLVKLDSNYDLAFPKSYVNFSLSTPAINFLTDFKSIRPLLIEADVKIDEALNMMKKSHVRLKIVVNRSEKMLGSISYSDIVGERPMKLVSKTVKRETLIVSDIMTPIEDLDAIDLAELDKHSIGELFELLKHDHKTHIFIRSDPNVVSGLISASDICRKLKIPFSVDSGATFKGIFGYSNQE